jgi:exosortase E/protease (VPEID-CTERM system)
MASAFATKHGELPQQARHTLPWLRWTGLTLLLALELLLLSMRFDTDSLNDVRGEWALAVALSPRLIRLVIVAAVVGVVLHAQALAHYLRTADDCSVAARSWPWFLVMHLLSLSVFAWLTLEILERGRAAGALAPAWVLAWLGGAASTAATWGLAALPRAVWAELARIARSGLAVGLAVGVAVWASEVIADGFWQPLARGTLWCAGNLLKFVYPDVVCEPSTLVIATPAFAVRIDPDCSGYEGMALILAFLGGYLWFDRETLRMPQALILLPLGAVASWLANVLRTALLVAIGSSWSEKIAMGGFHSQAGAIAFSSIGLALVVVARRSTWFARPTDLTHEADSNPTAAYLVPLLSVVAVGMLTSAFSHGLDGLYPLRVWAGLVALWYFRCSYSEQFEGPDRLGSPSAPLPSKARIASLVPAFALGTSVFVVWVLLAPEGETGAGPAAALANWPAAWRPVWWLSRIVGYLFLAPVIEEMAFRSFLIRRLTAFDFEKADPQCCPWWAIAISALAFGALHGGFWVAGILAGLAYGFAYCRRGRLGDAVTAHAMTNTLLLVYAATTGKWSLLS